MAAVKTKRVPIPPKVGDYWPRYRKRALIYTIAVQIIGTLIIGLALMITGAITSIDTLVIILIAALAAAALLNVILVMNLIVPLGDISAALTHISGEPTIVTPPNPNDRHFERDGFKPLLQLVYTISSKRNKPSSEMDTAPKIDFDDMLATLPVGFVAMDSDGKILYANKAAPVRIDPDGNTSLELLFEESDSLKKWVQECSERSVHPVAP